MSDPILRTAASAMAAQNARVASISNNIANVNTSGFKATRLRFEDLMYQDMPLARAQSLPGVETTNPIQVGRGVRVSATTRDQAQGALEVTNRALDIAIDGAGFLPVRLPDGATAYTRDGNLHIGPDGTIVTNQGYILEPGLAVPDGVGEISISPEGLVTGIYSGTQEVVEIGEIELVRFVNPEGLSARGENLFLQTEASGEAVLGSPRVEGFGRIIQGALEGSNVEIVTEMVEMIAAMRAYELGAKAVQSADDMGRTVSQLIR